MLSLKSICSPPFIVSCGTLQSDSAPADLRSDVDVFRPLCGLRKLPLVATACAATMCHCAISFLLNVKGRQPVLVACLYFTQKSPFCQYGECAQILLHGLHLPFCDYILLYFWQKVNLFLRFFLFSLG